MGHTHTRECPATSCIPSCSLNSVGVKQKAEDANLVKVLSVTGSSWEPTN